MSMRFYFLLAMILVSWGSAHARTISVQLDGTGDFEDLQEASEAAASGDTIFIGPGEFGKHGMAVPSSCFGTTYDMVVNVQVERLTIIGSGPTETILGPEVPYNDPSNPRMVGIALSGECGSKFAVIKDLCVRNCSAAVYSVPAFGGFTFYEDTGVYVENCAFDRNYGGVAFNGFRTEVRNCLSDSDLTGGYFVASLLGGYATYAVVDGCTSTFTALQGVHVGVGAIRSLTVTNCNFKVVYPIRTGGGVVSLADHSTLENIWFSGLDKGIRAEGYDMTIRSCNFDYVDYGIRCMRDCRSVVMEDSHFTTILKASAWYYDRIQTFDISSCSLGKGSLGVIKTYPWQESSSDVPDAYDSSGSDLPMRDEVSILEGTRHLDMRDNYWGTDNPDSIRAWIEDSEDIEGWPITVDWYPFRAENVAETKPSLGDLKAMFR